MGKTLEEELALEGKGFKFFEIVGAPPSRNIRIPGIYPMDTVEAVKAKIEDHMGFEPEYTDLKLDGRSLVDSNAFSYEITNYNSDYVQEVMIDYNPPDLAEREAAREVAEREVAREVSERNFTSICHGKIKGGFIFVPENVTLHTYVRFGHAIYQTPEDIHIKNMLNNEPFYYPGPGKSRVNFSDRRDGNNKFTDAGYSDESEWMDIDYSRDQINKKGAESYKNIGYSFLSKEEEEAGSSESLSQYFTFVKKEMRTYESGQILPEHELNYSHGFNDRMTSGLIDIDKLKVILEAEEEREKKFLEVGIPFKEYAGQLNPSDRETSTKDTFRECDPSFQKVLSAIRSYLINYYGQPIYEEFFKTPGLDFSIMAELAGEGCDIISKAEQETEKAKMSSPQYLYKTLRLFDKVQKSKKTDGLLGGYLLNTSAKDHSLISNRMKLSELFEKAQKLSENTPGAKINIYLYCCRILSGAIATVRELDNGFDAYGTQLKKCTEIDPDIFQGTFLQEILNQDLYSLTREKSFSGLEIKKDQIISKLELYKERVLQPFESESESESDIETFKIKFFPNHPSVLRAITFTILRNYNKEVMIPFLKKFHIDDKGDEYIFNGIEDDDTLTETHIINKLLNSGDEGNITKALDLIRLYFIKSYEINESAFKVFYITYFIIYILPKLRKKLSRWRGGWSLPPGIVKDAPPPDMFVPFDLEQDNTNLIRYGCFGNFNISVLCNLLYFNKSMTTGNLESFCEYVDDGLYEKKCAEEERQFSSTATVPPLEEDIFPIKETGIEFQFFDEKSNQVFLDLEIGTTADVTKKVLMDKTGIPEDNMDLSFEGVSLIDGESLFYQIMDKSPETSIKKIMIKYIAPNTGGGHGIKMKRTKYKKSKKNKHKGSKKKNKLKTRRNKRKGSKKRKTRRSRRTRRRR